MKILLVKPTNAAVLVDDDVYEWAQHMPWWLSGQGYVGHRTSRTTEYLHKLVRPAPRGMRVDHIDSNKMNNCRANLRICTQKQNIANAIKHCLATSTSKFKSVYWQRTNKKWIAQATVKRQVKYLGSFSNEHAAALVADLWSKDLYGEFAKTNFLVVAHS